MPTARGVFSRAGTREGSPKSPIPATQFLQALASARSADHASVLCFQQSQAKNQYIWQNMVLCINNIFIKFR